MGVVLKRLVPPSHTCYDLIGKTDRSGELRNLPEPAVCKLRQIRNYHKFPENLERVGKVINQHSRRPDTAQGASAIGSHIRNKFLVLGEGN
jgi:hypothetical protein